MDGAFANPDTLVRLTGVSPAEFDRLSGEFSLLWEREYCARTVRGRERRGWKPAGYKGGFRNPRTMLFFVLLYYEVYPTQKALGTLFGMTQQWASVWLAYLTPLARRVTMRPLLVPDRKPLGWMDLVSFEPALLLLVDPLEAGSSGPTTERGQGDSLVGLW